MASNGRNRTEIDQIGHRNGPNYTEMYQNGHQNESEMFKSRVF